MYTSQQQQAIYSLEDIGYILFQSPREIVYGITTKMPILRCNDKFIKVLLDGTTEDATKQYTVVK